MVKTWTSLACARDYVVVELFGTLRQTTAADEAI